MIYSGLRHLILKTSATARSSLRQNLTSQFLHQKTLYTMKLDTPQFKNLFTTELSELANIFKRHNYEIRIVGGAVRDILMGKQPHDIDFATTATPDEMKTMFSEEGIRMLNMNGERHGTITVRINDKVNFEVTTLRVDTATDGRHAEVLFTTDWYLDAQRRDLTINAMFLGLDGTLYDYFNGAEHLEKHQVLFVGDIAERLKEDYLRILRYFRFFGRIAEHPESHDPVVLEAISSNLDGLSKLSGERLMAELRKIMTGNFSKELMLKMVELGVTNYLGLPPKLNIEEFKQVCDRTILLNPNAVTLIVALLYNDTEIIAFHKRMKMSNFERDMCLFINKHRSNTETHLKFLKTLLYSNSSKPSDVHDWITELLKYRGEVELLNDFMQWEMPKFPVSGLDLLQHGVGKGPQMAHILNELKRVWSESDFEKNREDLLECIESIKQKRLKK